MGVELTIRITSPLDEEDRDLLSGVAVMTLAIANHEMAKNAFPDAFGGDDEAEQPTPCAFLNPKDPNLACVGVARHRGRHRFRRMAVEGEAAGVLPN